MSNKKRVAEKKPVKKSIDELEKELNVAEIPTTFLDSLANGIIILDKKLTIKKINDTVLKILHKKKATLIGKNYLEANPFNVEKAELKKILNNVLDDTKLMRIETIERFVTSHNDFFLKKIYTPLKDKNKKIAGVVIEIENVTRQIYMEDSLKRKEANLRHIIDNINDIILTLNRKKKILSINKKGCSIIKLSKEKIIGKYFKDFLERSQIKFFNFLLRNLKKGTTSLETIMIDKNQKNIPVYVHITLIKRKNKPVGYLCIIKDLRETKRLQKEYEEKISRLSAIHELGKTSTKIMDLSKTLETIARKIPEMIDAYACTIMLYDKKTDTITPKAVYNLPSENYLEKQIDLKNTLTGKAIKSGKIKMSENVQVDPRFKNKSFARKFKLKAFMCIPLVVQGECIGTVNIYSREKKYFKLEEIRFAKFIANYIAVLVKNAKLVDDIKAEKERLQSLLIVSQAINSIMNLEKLLNLILEKAMDVVNADCGALLLIENNSLVIKAVSGYGNSIKPNTKFDKKKSICAYVAKTGLPLIIGDVKKEKIYFQVNKKIKSETAFPLIVKGNIIGVLLLSSYKENAFEKTSWMLSILANNAAIAIDNANIYEKINRNNLELIRLYEISTFLQSTMDINQIIDKAIEAFLNLGYDRVRIYMYDPTTNECYGVKSSDIPDEEFKKVRFKVDKRHKKSYMCFVKRQPVILKENKKDPNIHILRKEDVKESASFPLYSANKKIGMISIDNKFSKRPINKEELNMLMIFANQIAVAIDNAVLYDEINKFNEKLTEEIKQATKELSEKNRRLMELDKMKSEFVSIVSHELKTPLTSIKGYVSLLLDERIKDKETQKKALQIVKDESDRLSSLIKDILDLSRLESNRSEIKFVKVDLREIVDDVCDAMLNLAIEKKINLIRNLPKKISCVRGDKDKLKQILTNLLSNSFKFTPEGGEVSVSITENPELVLCTVKDNGCGIPVNKIPFLGNKFYQVEWHMTRHKGGTGLGLAIVKQLLEIHNGLWSIYSDVGKGTTITFALPKIENNAKTKLQCWKCPARAKEKCPDFDSDNKLCVATSDLCMFSKPQ